MCAMQTVNIDSNDFAEIRSRGYVYVDKTAWFHRLATAEGRKMFFLARPLWLGKGENVYNPVSINLTMANQKDEFELYWAETGKASFLMNMLARGDVLAIDPEKLENVSKAMLDVSDLRKFPVVGMLFQTGYLTILDYNKKTKRLTLGIPNAVGLSFNDKTRQFKAGVAESVKLKV